MFKLLSSCKTPKSVPQIKSDAKQLVLKKRSNNSHDYFFPLQAFRVCDSLFKMTFKTTRTNYVPCFLLAYRLPLIVLDITLAIKQVM